MRKSKFQSSKPFIFFLLSWIRQLNTEDGVCKQCCRYLMLTNSCDCAQFPWLLIVSTSHCWRINQSKIVGWLALGVPNSMHSSLSILHTQSLIAHSHRSSDSVFHSFYASLIENRIFFLIFSIHWKSLFDAVVCCEKAKKISFFMLNLWYHIFGIKHLCYIIKMKIRWKKLSKKKKQQNNQEKKNFSCRSFNIFHHLCTKYSIVFSPHCTFSIIDNELQFK